MNGPNLQPSQYDFNYAVTGTLAPSDTLSTALLHRQARCHRHTGTVSHTVTGTLEPSDTLSPVLWHRQTRCHRHCGTVRHPVTGNLASSNTIRGARPIDNKIWYRYIVWKLQIQSKVYYSIMHCIRTVTSLTTYSPPYLLWKADDWRAISSEAGGPITFTKHQETHSQYRLHVTMNHWLWASSVGRHSRVTDSERVVTGVIHESLIPSE